MRRERNIQEFRRFVAGTGTRVSRIVPQLPHVTTRK
jgi:hypothetical protein